MKELANLVSRFDSHLASWDKLPSDSFTLENGSAQLGALFENISLYRYIDSLIVTDVDMLVDYILSGRIELTSDQKYNFTKHVEKELKVKNGKFYITKDSGVFELSGIL